MGKTTALDAISAIWDVPVIDGTLLTGSRFDELVGRKLAELPSLAESAQPLEKKVRIIIDQVDESPELLHLGRLLHNASRGRDTRSLHLVLACRTADAPTELIRFVRDISLEYHLADLAPLSRPEAALLASTIDRVDGQAVVDLAIEAGAGAFAATPLTLELLAQAYRDDPTLEPTARAIFERGATKLIEDWVPKHRVTAELTVGQRMEVAKEIAAKLVLSGRRTIWTGSIADELHDDHDLLLDDLAQVSSANTNRSIREVLGTALFTGRGEDRLAFAHSSITAFLAATYLAEQRTPAAQLRDLFLVPVGLDRHAIPSLLRETAAWLATLTDAHHGWLIEADAESLAPHGPVIDSPAVRRLVVEVLLRRSDEIELTHAVWGYQDRSFRHPDLGTQLLAAITSASSQDPASWPAQSLMRLALRIATNEQLPELVPALLAVVVDDRWPMSIRSHAARISYEGGSAEAAEALSALLGSLAASQTHTINSMDDLMGTLIELLWPEHLATAEMLPYLLGPYRRPQTTLDRFRRTFAQSLSKEDVAPTLQWALHHAVSSNPQPAAQLDGDEEGLLGNVPDELITDLIDRALADSCWRDHLPAVAQLASLRLHKRPPLPAPFALIDDNGVESLQTQDARRQFASHLLHLPNPTATDGWDIAFGWERPRPARNLMLETAPGYSDRRHLLDADDFPWAYAQAGEAEAGQAQRSYSELALMLLRSDRTDDTDLLASDPSHPVYRHAAHLLEPMPLNCDAAKNYCELQRRTKRLDRRFTDEQTIEFLVSQNRLLDAALGGNTGAFLTLVYNLQFDPERGEGSVYLFQPLITFPAAAALGRSDELLRACGTFVNTADDDRAGWLGTDTLHLAAWAGYLALEHLLANDQLGAVNDSAWSRWTGAVLWFHTSHEPEAGEAKERLLEEIYRRAPQALADAIDCYFHRNINGGNRGHLLTEVDPGRSSTLVATYLAILHRLTAAMGAVPEHLDDPLPEDVTLQIEQVDEQPLSIAPTPDAVRGATELWLWLTTTLASLRPSEVAELLTQQLPPSAGQQTSRRVVALASSALLWIDPSTAWPLVVAASAGDSDLGRAIAQRAATSGARIEAALDERQVVDLYRWLDANLPPDDESLPLTSGWHYAHDDAQEWPKRLLARLAGRGTQHAIAELGVLQHEYPNRLEIQAALTEARRSLCELDWRPPPPGAIGQLLADPSKRLVETDVQLAELVVHALHQIEVDLSTMGDVLWDCIPRRLRAPRTGDGWLPKPEPSIGGLLAHELRLRLNAGVVVNREVMVTPTNIAGAGTRVDIKVEAPSKRHEPTGRTPTAMVELKGSWHPDVKRAQDTQLAATYLRTTGPAAGVYVVLCFEIEQWTADANDSRLRLAKSRQPTVLGPELERQASEIRAKHGVITIPVIIRVTRPSAT